MDMAERIADKTHGFLADSAGNVEAWRLANIAGTPSRRTSTTATFGSW